MRASADFLAPLHTFIEGFALAFHDALNDHPIINERGTLLTGFKPRIATSYMGWMLRPDRCESTRPYGRHGLRTKEFERTEAECRCTNGRCDLDTGSSLIPLIDLDLALLADLGLSFHCLLIAALHTIVCPPSTTNACPTMNPAALEHIHVTVPAISSTIPILPIGSSEITFALASSLCPAYRSIIGVSM